ncbi:hypothetical protein GC093_31390, partial [Paenibacillus sp. LMG 31456]|nr:hypothetical protein [Paenibacillus foliorum]
MGRYLGTMLLAIALLLCMPNVSWAVGKGANGPDVFVIQGVLKSLGGEGKGPEQGKGKGKGKGQEQGKGKGGGKGQ